MHFVYQWMLDRSRHPLGRILTCGAIGNVMGWIVALPADHEIRQYAWLSAIGFAVAGLLAGTMLTTIDAMRAKDWPTRSNVARGAIVATFVGVLLKTMTAIVAGIWIATSRHR